MKKKNFVFGFLFFISCRKDSQVTNPAIITVDALVIDEGTVPLIADGCGWHILIATGIDYIPAALDSTFFEDSLPVKVTYYSIDSAGCGFAANLKTNPLMVIQHIELR